MGILVTYGEWDRASFAPEEIRRVDALIVARWLWSDLTPAAAYAVAAFILDGEEVPS